MRETLEQVEELLRRYGHTYHANLAMVAREAWGRDPEQGLRELNSSHWWGEADSVAAVDLAIDGGFSSRARRDGASLRAALIELARLLKERGVDNPEAELAAAQMRKWLVSGI